MDSVIPVECLGCGKQFRMPRAITKVAEWFDESRMVLFCSRKCNVQFVRRESSKMRVRKIKEMLDRAEAESDAFNRNPG